MRASRTVGAVTAAFVAVGGYVHLCLYRHGYRTIPKIGVGFLLQVLASAVIAVALLLGPHVVARAVHLSEGAAESLTKLAAGSLAAGTLVAFALTRTSAGLFSFRERGLQPAPQALVALVAELGVLVVVSGSELVRHARHDTITSGVRRV